MTPAPRPADECEHRWSGDDGTAKYCLDCGDDVETAQLRGRIRALTAELTAARKEIARQQDELGTWRSPTKEYLAEIKRREKAESELAEAHQRIHKANEEWLAMIKERTAERDAALAKLQTAMELHGSSEEQREEDAEADGETLTKLRRLLKQARADAEALRAAFRHEMAWKICGGHYHGLLDGRGRARRIPCDGALQAAETFVARLSPPETAPKGGSQ